MKRNLCPLRRCQQWDAETDTHFVAVAVAVAVADSSPRPSRWFSLEDFSFFSASSPNDIVSRSGAFGTVYEGLISTVDDEIYASIKQLNVNN